MHILTVNTCGFLHILCRFIHLVVSFAGCQFLYHNHIFLIHCCDEIFRFGSTLITHIIKCRIHSLPAALNNKYHTPYFRRNMKFLRAVVNIYQKQIIKKQVLDKVIFVKPLFICGQKAAQLKCRHLSNHVHIIIGSFCQQDVFQLVLVKYFKKLIAMNNLTVCR